jgi:hypothetical protein
MDGVPFNEAAVLRALEARLGGTPAPVNPIAVFDWDGTLVGTDTGDLLFFHAARRGLLELPPLPLQDSLPWLTPAGAGMLARLAEGARRGDAEAWTRELLCYYAGGITTEGEAAFLPLASDHFQPSYAILGPLLASLPETQFRAEARLLMQEGAGAQGHISLPGGHFLKRQIQPLRPLVDLFCAVRRRGLPVLVVSASPQILVEEGLRFLGLKPDAVLGLRCNPDGTLAHPGGEAPSPCIPYGEGKNAWIDWYLREGGLGEAELLLAAGNSLGDLPMLGRATAARVFVQEGPKAPTLPFRDQVPLWVLKEG